MRREQVLVPESLSLQAQEAVDLTFGGKARDPLVQQVVNTEIGDVDVRSGDVLVELGQYLLDRCR